MPAPFPQLPASPCPSPSGRSATRQRSSGRPRRRGQRSGSSGGPGLGPCTTAPLRTRMVSAGLGEGTHGPAALPAAGAAGHGSAVLCGRRARLRKPSSASFCCGVMLPGLCQAVPGPDGVPWLFPALVGLGVSWRLCVTVTVLRGGILGDSPGCLWGCRGHAARVSSSREESRVGCGAVRGHRCLSLGSVLWRVPLSPG